MESKIKITHLFHGLIFIAFCAVIVWAIFYYAPGWGFMDDYGNLNIAAKYWQQGASWESLEKLIQQDGGHGRFRPVYQVWTVTAYHYFADNPTLLYVCISAVCFLNLLVWGSVIRRIFHGSEDNSGFPLYVYPLSFFLFTPFWNNFMYVSILEKFVYLFSGPAIYYFIKSYDKKNAFYFILFILFGILSMLGKETGIALFMAVAAYSLIDLVFTRETRKLSIFALIVSSAIVVSYYLFIQNLLKSYTATYQSNLSAQMIFNNIVNGSVIIKSLFFASIFWILSFLTIHLTKKRRTSSSFSMIMPLFLMFYIVVLAPWKFVNYLLAPMAPMVLAMCYPIYLVIARKVKVLEWAMQLSVIGLAFCVAYTIILPRISKMADKRKIVSHVKVMKEEDPQATYFFPPPFMESSDMLGRFADVKITYLSSGMIDRSNYQKENNNYLIVGDQEGPVYLDGIDIERLVYKNGTWRIYRLKENPQLSRNFKYNFPRNSVEKIKDYIKRL